MVNIPLEIVAAVAANGVIGLNGRMAWYFADEFAYFRALTNQQVCVIGRRTYEALPLKPGQLYPRLVGRTLLVVSSEGLTTVDGVANTRTFTAHICSLAETLEHARLVAQQRGQKRVLILGGEFVYQQTLPLCARLHLSHVHQTPRGDAHFPRFDPQLYDLELGPQTEYWHAVSYTRKEP